MSTWKVDCLPSLGAQWQVQVQATAPAGTPPMAPEGAPATTNSTAPVNTKVFDAVMVCNG